MYVIISYVMMSLHFIYFIIPGHTFYAARERHQCYKLVCVANWAVRDDHNTSFRYINNICIAIVKGVNNEEGSKSHEDVIDLCALLFSSIFPIV